MGEKKPKSDAAEVAKRVEEVLRIRLDGAQFHDIVQYAAEKGWGDQRPPTPQLRPPRG